MFKANCSLNLPAFPTPTLAIVCQLAANNPFRNTPTPAKSTPSWASASSTAHSPRFLSISLWKKFACDEKWRSPVWWYCDKESYIFPWRTARSCLNALPLSVQTTSWTSASPVEGAKRLISAWTASLNPVFIAIFSSIKYCILIDWGLNPAFLAASASYKTNFSCVIASVPCPIKAWAVICASAFVKLFTTALAKPSCFCSVKSSLNELTWLLYNIANFCSEVTPGALSSCWSPDVVAWTLKKSFQSLPPTSKVR